jgi:hypothetical protein
MSPGAVHPRKKGPGADRFTGAHSEPRVEAYELERLARIPFDPLHPGLCPIIRAIPSLQIGLNGSRYTASPSNFARLGLFQNSRYRA